MTADQIMREIPSGEFTNSELNDMRRAIQFARAQLAQKSKRGFYPGLTV